MTSPPKRPGSNPPRADAPPTQPSGLDTSWFANFALDEDADPSTSPGALAEPETQGASRGWAQEAAAPQAGPGRGPAAADTQTPPGPDGSPAAQAGEDTGTRSAALRARALLSGGAPSFVRLYRTFMGARAMLAIVLVAIIALGYAFGERASWVTLGLSAVYALATLLRWWLPPPRPASGGTVIGMLSKRAWLATIGLDIAVLSVLHVLTPPALLNLPMLMALPVLMSGVMTPRRWALASAAAITLVLLAVAAKNGGRTADMAVLMTQAGLLGAGYFAIAVLAGEMSTRLASEQQSARGSLELARQQAQLNRLVIDEMQDGVLVVDRRGRVRAANPAARRMLVAEGRTRAAPFQLRGVKDWEPLVQAVEQAFLDGAWPDAGREVTLPLATRSGVNLRELRLRVRFTKRRDTLGKTEATEDLCVLFVEDVRNIYERVRQEKLAAMGRMSAGIAHEIRNPLAAIAQANALLAEDATTPAQHKLTAMVSSNVERLKRIVDDVLDVAPGQRGPAPVIDVAALVAVACDEWRRTTALAGDLSGSGPGGALHLHLARGTGGGAPPGAADPTLHTRARFEPEHLRRVLVNLLDNAWRHSTHTAGAVQVQVMARPGAREDEPPTLLLSVANDGDPIAPQVERSLFEPFFSTRSLGTGLGLYICRELCERHGASIDYRQREAPVRHRNEFMVTMRAAPAPHPPSATARTAST